MPKTLDKSRPFAEVHGLPGVCYEQDGVTFNRAGIPAVGVPYVEEIQPPEDKSVVHSVEYQASPPQDEAGEGSTIEKMHWKHLKTLVESYGGEWTNRQDAIIFLKKGEK